MRFTSAHLLRELSPQVLGILVRRFGDFSASEDALQEALTAAALQWPSKGVPENPGAWLIHVAARRVTDHIRAELARRRRETAVALEELEGEPMVAAPDTEQTGERDDTLILLFMCCHPALTRSRAHAARIARRRRAHGRASSTVCGSRAPVGKGR